MSSHSTDGIFSGTSADAAHGWIPSGECASVEPFTSAAHGWIPSGECANDTANASSDYSNTVTRRPHQRQEGRCHGHSNHGVKSRGSIPGTCADAAHGWIPPGECASTEPYTSAAHGWIPSGECANHTINASTDNSDTGSIRRRQQQEGGDHGHKDKGLTSRVIISGTNNDGAHGWIPPGSAHPPSHLQVQRMDGSLPGSAPLA